MSQHHLSAAGTGMEEDENVLKTALAFVVLRQRVAHKLAATRGSRDIRRIQGHGRDRDHHDHMYAHDQHQEPLFESSTSPSIVTQMSNGNSHSRSDSNSNTNIEGDENGNGDEDGNEDEVENGNRVITNTNRLKRKFPESTGIGNDNDVIDDIDKGNSDGNSNGNSNSTGDSATLPFLRRIHINEIGTSKADAFINNANGSATGTGNKTETEAATTCTKSRHISTMFRIALSTAHSLYVPYVCKLTTQIEEEGEEQAHSHETESEMQMQMDESETNSASTSTSTPVSSISDSQDIRIEASTNTGDDCDDYGGGSGNSNEHDNLYNEGHGHERVDVGIPMPSTFYDYKTASWTRDEIQTQIESESESHIESLSSCADYSSAYNAAATYNALDRILMNLASDLNSFISYKHQHQYRQETDGIDCSHGIVYSLFMAPLVDKLFGRNSNSGSGSTDGKKPIQIILTMCTILHRLVFLDSMTSISLPSNLVDDIIISISKMLQTLYYHDFPPWTTSASFTDGSRTGDNGNSNGCGVGEVINGGDVYAKLMIQLPDILAVNCLVLLEEIVSLKLSKEVSRNYDDRCNGDGNEDGDGDGDECIQSSESDGYEHRGGDGDGYEYHGGGYVVGDSLSEVAGEILNILTVALGGLILPIPVQEMSSFYIRDKEEMDAQMKRDFNLYSRLSCTYGNQNQYELEGKSNLNVGHLNSGAKMMLRLSLFNIVQKLSSSHIGDIHL